MPYGVIFHSVPEKGLRMNHKFPWFSFEKNLHWLFYKRLLFGKRFKKYGKGSYVSPFSDITNLERISIGEKVQILRGAWIMAIDQYSGQLFDPEIVINDETYIGHDVTLSCVNRIDIGKGVTFGDNVYVADNEHTFDDVTQSVMKQPLTVGSISIGDFTWVGKNSVIFGNVTIGNNVIIGANSVVTKSIAPYTIAVGSPAKAIKHYDHNSGRWVSVKQ